MVSMRHTLRFLLNHPLAARRRWPTLARFARWQLTSRGGAKPVVHDWLEGVRFLVRRGETGLTGNLYAGLHEFEDMAFVLHVLRPGDLFVDIGANAGAYTLLGCGVAGASGVSVEPIPETYSRLVANLALNQLQSRVEAHQVGLADRAGLLRFSADGDTINHALAEDETAACTVEVPVLTLDELLAGRAPMLIKLDVEGLEDRVLAGATQTLRQASLRALVMETNQAGARYGRDEDRLWRVVREAGFEPVRYEPFARRLSPLGADRADSGNTLFVRDAALLQRRVQESKVYRVHGIDL